MRVMATVLLLLIISVQLVHRTGIAVRFNLNQAEIAQTLCVKKEVKGNTCQGKCHLKKMMQASEDADKKSPAREGRQWLMPLAMPVQSTFIFRPFANLDTFAALASSVALGVQLTVFRPPKGL